MHFPIARNSVASTSLSSIFRGKAEENMARRRGQRDGWLHEKNGTWLLTYRVYRWDAEKRRSVPARPTVSIGPAEGPGKLTWKQAERFAWDHFLSKIDNTAIHPKSTMSPVRSVTYVSGRTNNLAAGPAAAFRFTPP